MPVRRDLSLAVVVGTGKHAYKLNTHESIQIRISTCTLLIGLRRLRDYQTTLTAVYSVHVVLHKNVLL